MTGVFDKLLKGYQPTLEELFAYIQAEYPGHSVIVHYIEPMVDMAREQGRLCRSCENDGPYYARISTPEVFASREREGFAYVAHEADPLAALTKAYSNLVHHIHDPLYEARKARRHERDERMKNRGRNKK